MKDDVTAELERMSSSAEVESELSRLRGELPAGARTPELGSGQE